MTAKNDALILVVPDRVHDDVLSNVGIDAHIVPGVVVFCASHRISQQTSLCKSEDHANVNLFFDQAVSKLVWGSRTSSRDHFG
ncbi:hypothetical protein RRF57_008593 [Xylaria bambusicola]|uniref:Uncharacterized protein n=1 Tax=Xylaria bambusicola TaxID=326684 RepID=A0AAN7UY95_9PEZI